MDYKSLLKQHAEIRIERNYVKIEQFYKQNFIFMISLNSIRWEILYCLLLENYNASITLTNHFVERMLKLSLIQLESAKIKSTDFEKYSKNITHQHNQYDHLKLHDTIKHNKKKNLISDEESTYLSTTCKMFRDSYSHAQIEIINKEQPKGFSGYLFNLDDVKQKLINGETDFNKTNVKIPKEFPSIAQFYQIQASRENALEYFTRINDILINIEKRLEKI